MSNEVKAVWDEPGLKPYEVEAILRSKLVDAEAENRRLKRELERTKGPEFPKRAVKLRAESTPTRR